MRMKPVAERRDHGAPMPIPDEYHSAQSKEELLERLQAGEKLFVNTALPGVVFEGVKFENTDFQNSNFNGCTFRDCHFDQTVLYRASLQNCTFENIRASHCIFNQADFFESRFDNCQIIYCDFTGACLVKVIFESSYPVANTFIDTWFQFTSFLRSPFTLNDLSKTHHPTPGYCTIDVMSLALSAKLIKANFEAEYGQSDHEILYRQREVAEDLNNVAQFLSRCGLPSEVFSLYTTLVSSAKHESVFISYSTADETFARELQSELSKQGIETWFAPHDMQGGRTILDQVQRGIRTKDRVILILSDSSMASGWVSTEIRTSLNTDLGIAKLFPIRIVDYSKIRKWQLFDPDVGTDLAVRIREFFIPDFTEWTSREKFSVAVTGLVRALQKAADDASASSASRAAVATLSKCRRVGAQAYV